MCSIPFLSRDCKVLCCICGKNNLESNTRKVWMHIYWNNQNNIHPPQIWLSNLSKRAESTLQCTHSWEWGRDDLILLQEYGCQVKREQFRPRFDSGRISIFTVIITPCAPSNQMYFAWKLAPCHFLPVAETLGKYMG